MTLFSTETKKELSRALRQFLQYVLLRVLVPIGGSIGTLYGLNETTNIFK